MIIKPSDFPPSCGVYIFKRNRHVLYIGKSINIKARLASHIENAKFDAKERLIITEANKLTYIDCDSEFNALLLESQLIKKFHPKYNARWQDDKSYLYIKITTHEIFPKIFVVRREYDGISLYFGPFSSYHNVEEILKQIRRIFPFCSQKKISKHACFYSKIGLCNPCPSFISHATSANEKRILTKIYRQNIRSIIKVLRGQIDPIVNLLQKQLRVLSKQNMFEEAMMVRNKLYRFEHLIYHTHIPLDRPDFYNRSQERLTNLRSLLITHYPKLPEIINRIECYDVSNTGGREATGSMVAFTEGNPDKSQYRKFKIKSLDLKSDFEMLKETLIRRFSKRSWLMPDLVVIDGGQPQLKIVQEVWNQKELDIPFVGIAKNPDRLVIGITFTTLKYSIDNSGFNLIQALRDESHRFARKYHRYLRDKKLHL